MNIEQGPKPKINMIREREIIVSPPDTAYWCDSKYVDSINQPLEWYQSQDRIAIKRFYRRPVIQELKRLKQKHPLVYGIMMTIFHPLPFRQK